VINIEALGEVFGLQKEQVTGTGGDWKAAV